MRRNRTHTLVTTSLTAALALLASTVPAFGLGTPGAWGPLALVDRVGAAVDMSCPSSHFCAVDDQYGFVYLLDGTTWHRDEPDPDGFLAGVSCTSPQFCVAVDFVYGTYVRYNGDTWSKPVVIDPHGGGQGGGLASVSCTSATFCMAFDNYGHAMRYNGKTWTEPQVIMDSSGLEGTVSCSSRLFCVADDVGGYVSMYDGSAWSTPVKVDPHFGLYPMSCLSSIFCLGLDEENYVVRYDGTSWSLSGPMADYDSYGPFDRVSCASNAFCVAFAQHIYVAYFDGSTWSVPDGHDPGDNNETAAVSCPSVRFCAMYDTSGFVTMFRSAHARSG